MPNTSSSSASTEQPTNDLLTRDPELQRHLTALDLNSIEEYVQWCQRNGFSTRVDKHWRQRCKERYFASQSAISRTVRSRKTQKRHPRRTLNQIFSGQLEAESLGSPHLRLIHQLAQQVPSPIQRVFRDVALKAESCSQLLSSRPAIKEFGTQPGNTFINGLLRLCHHHDDWLQPIDSWRPSSRNPSRQFHSLVRHLLAKYSIPAFMDSVWFQQRDDAMRRENWFKKLAKGCSPRDLDFPIPVTKKMTGPFSRSTNVSTVEEALRLAQIISLGGERRLFESVLDSRMSDDFGNETFWVTVVHWLVKNPMLAPDQVSPLIDYIYRRKFESDEFTEEHLGEFSMKGRTALSLLRQMHRWHARLRQRVGTSDVEWGISTINEFSFQDGEVSDQSTRHWTIRELLNWKELHAEGRAMRHCVASYASMCCRGETSIWSLGVERNSGRRSRVLTIEVTPKTKVIRQIRGRRNRLARAKELEILRRWADQEGLELKR